MKYLKIYNDLSFEDFQDLFVDITDKYDDFEYNIKKTGFYKQINYSYEIKIKSKLPDFLIKEDVYDIVNNEKNELDSININIDKMLKITGLVKEIEEVIKRLLKFDNCLEVQIRLGYVGMSAEITLQYIIR